MLTVPPGACAAVPSGSRPPRALAAGAAPNRVSSERRLKFEAGVGDFVMASILG